MNINLELLKDFDAESVILIEWLINQFLQSAKYYYMSTDFPEKNKIMLWTSEVILNAPFPAVKSETILEKLEKAKHISRSQDLFEFCLNFETPILKQHFKNRLKEVKVK